VDVVDAVLSQRSAVEAEPWGHYVLIDFAARWTAGEPTPADDAIEARFFGRDELAALGLWSETLRVIEAARPLVQG
jgi:8-oxo-dGTP diphosphatase